MACKISAKSATQRPPPESGVPPLTAQAVHQDELTYPPTDSIDRLFGNAAVVIQQGHVRLVLRLHPAPEANFLQCSTKTLTQDHQSGDTIASSQHEWLVA